MSDPSRMADPDLTRDIADRAVLARQVEGIAERVGRIPVQLDDAATLRRAAEAIRNPLRPIAALGVRSDTEGDADGA
jgi:hypothetical protein